MVISQSNQDYKQVVEKIVFDETELEDLKIAIRKFSNGKIDSKSLKKLLLQSRGRIVDDVSHFLSFCIERIKDEDISPKAKKPARIEQPNQKIIKLQQDLEEKNELLKVVANKVSILVENLKKK